MCSIVPNNTISLFYQREKMTLQHKFLKGLLTLIFITATMCGLRAQSLKASDSLYKEIARMDTVLFNAFNSRDMENFKMLFTEDLEFYHDKGGLTNYAYTIESFKNTIARNDGLRRDLVKGSLEVYPINNYGAVEIGAHTFCHLENGKQDCGTFRFVHVWKKTDNGWKISRVISYDH